MSRPDVFRHVKRLKIIVVKLYLRAFLYTEAHGRKISLISSRPVQGMGFSRETGLTGKRNIDLLGKEAFLLLAP